MKRMKEYVTETPDESEHDIIIALLVVGIVFAKCSQQKFIRNKRCGSVTIHKIVYCVLFILFKGVENKYTIYENGNHFHYARCTFHLFE